MEEHSSCCASVTYILNPLNPLQRFLYRANDIEGVDKVALQRDILDVVVKEGETLPPRLHGQYATAHHCT